MTFNSILLATNCQQAAGGLNLNSNSHFSSAQLKYIFYYSISDIELYLQSFWVYSWVGPAWTPQVCLESWSPPPHFKVPSGGTSTSQAHLPVMCKVEVPPTLSTSLWGFKLARPRCSAGTTFFVIRCSHFMNHSSTVRHLIFWKLRTWKLEVS